MTKLLIIVPKGSALDFYLVDSGFIFDEIVRISHSSYYKINVTDKMDLINFFISKFSLQDYTIRCDHGEFIFRVRS